MKVCLLEQEIYRRKLKYIGTMRNKKIISMEVNTYFVNLYFYLWSFNAFVWVNQVF